MAVKKTKRNIIKPILSSVDKFILDNVVKKNGDKTTKTTMRTHENKLRNLTKSLSLPFTVAETAHNLSSKLLTTDELEVSKVWIETSYSPFANK